MVPKELLGFHESRNACVLCRLTGVLGNISFVFDAMLLGSPRAGHLVLCEFR